MAFQEHLHPELVGFFIALSAGCANARSFCGIEHAKLDAGGVGIESHRSAQRVDFTNHVPFGESTYRGITGHLANGIRVLSEEKRLATEAGCRQGGFNASVASPNHDNVVVFWINEVAQVTRSRCRVRSVSFGGRQDPA